VVSAFVHVPAEEWEQVGSAAVPPAPPEESLADLEASFLASR